VGMVALGESFFMRRRGGGGAGVEVASGTGAEGDILGRLVKGEFGRDGGMWGLGFGVVEVGGVVGWVMPWERGDGIRSDRYGGD
jgi:hypothetical protein